MKRNIRNWAIAGLCTAMAITPGCDCRRQWEAFKELPVEDKLMFIADALKYVNIGIQALTSQYFAAGRIYKNAGDNIGIGEKDVARDITQYIQEHPEEF